MFWRLTLCFSVAKGAGTRSATLGESGGWHLERGKDEPVNKKVWHLDQGEALPWLPQIAP